MIAILLISATIDDDKQNCVMIYIIILKLFIKKTYYL